MVTGPLDPALFAPSCLQAVPEAQLRARYGEGRDVQVPEQNSALDSERGALNEQARVSLLVLAPVTPDVTFPSLPEGRGLRCPARAGCWGRRHAAPRPPRSGTPYGPGAVGAAFKLANPAKLQARVQGRTLRWTGKLVLTGTDRSLPGGSVHTAPTGSRPTPRDLAARMIPQRDNTATDLLLGAAGPWPSRPASSSRLCPAPAKASL
ncbi:serine hydrolase [Deinococcus taeanensis]|uniref:serine hydrolase n=1 Tax=Deinococcus taeanensis TaxID=2737050 RepID=UPI001CDC4625|nr:serine hydrolase [Deinococcus taeanensis]